MRLGCFAALFFVSCAQSQTQPPILGTPDVDQAIQRSLLPYAGTPFHALLDISHAGDTDHSGQVEIWWVTPTNYHVRLSAPAFTQSKIVNSERMEEIDTGTFLPRWLETFERALLDPVPAILRGHSSDVKHTANMEGLQTPACVFRDDRPDGITDQMTWGRLCLDTTGTHIGSILTFTENVNFSDWKPFAGQDVSRQLTTYIHDDHPVVATLTTLEPISSTDQASLLTISPTSRESRLETKFVPTSQAESLLETAPAIQWPDVREGKTEGYMIIYVRTDRTGQVREAYPHNADNAGLQDFGAMEALKYKFKPLLINGVPTQMETPLVLHFSSKITDPIVVLSVSDMKRQIIRCQPDPVPAGVLSKDQTALVRVSVSENGTIVGTQPASTAPWNRLLTSWMSVKKSCSFKPYLVNGKPVFYKGDVELPVR